ncbi:GH24970 [Drosophila grimshawi]|uniref:GH24970 n=1 Tax=Drosophila grimshawi TaxID=7222 RepID=B4K2U4_DROGR|nr:GH24970 [Drosophila grimshawi]
MENQRSNNNQNHRRGVRPSVGYLLFQYQSELTRRHAEPSRLSRTKIHIIDNLVSRTIRQLKHCSVEELQACKRELVYKEQLRDELRTLRRRKCNTASSSSATSSCSSSSPSPAPVQPAPRTPPKPRALIESKVSIFGPEIFV